MMKNVCSITLKVLLLSLFFSSPLFANPGEPVIQQATANTQRQWVLIHGDVSFPIPVDIDSMDGTALVTWDAVPGATHYEYRIASNGVWSTWQSANGQLFANLAAAGSSAILFEVRACDSYGCGNAIVETVEMTAWRNVGMCNPSDGKQKQICTGGRLCTIDSVRYVIGMCAANIECTP